MNTASPIGTPFTDNNRTGEFDVGDWVGKFGKGLVKKAGKVAWKVAKAVARPVHYVLALKSGYEYFRDANAGAKKWGCRSDASFDLPPPQFFFLREWPVYADVLPGRLTMRRHCPICGESVDAANPRCEMCGHLFDEAAAASVAAPPDPPPPPELFAPRGDSVERPGSGGRLVRLFVFAAIPLLSVLYRSCTANP